MPILLGFFPHFLSGQPALERAQEKNETPIIKKLTFILSNLNNFHPLEVVDRVSETQLQVGENFN